MPSGDLSLRADLMEGDPVKDRLSLARVVCSEWVKLLFGRFGEACDGGASVSYNNTHAR